MWDRERERQTAIKTALQKQSEEQSWGKRNEDVQ